MATVSPQKMNNLSGLEEKERIVREKKINATLYDYVALMVARHAKRLTTTHSVPGVFKLKVVFELELDDSN